MNSNGKKIQLFLSYSAYVLSGFMIFTPLFKSENVLISVTVSFIICFFCFEISNLIYQRWNGLYGKSKPSKLISAAITLCAVFSTLLLLTEIIKDTAYITGKGVSMFYYISLSLCLAAVAFYLTIGKSNGIYRFSVLSFIPLTALLLVGFFAPLTTKNIFLSVLNTKNLLPSVKTGIFSGIFTASDTVLYLIFFAKHNSKNNKETTAVFRLSLLFSHILMLAFCLMVFMTFGSNLVRRLDDAYFALIKLIPGIDFTEFIATARIIAFMLKTGVYIGCSSQICANAFSKQKKPNTSIYKALSFCLIPLIYLSFILFGGKMRYGAFQSAIYTLIPVLSFLTVIYLITKHKKKQR